MLAPGVADPVSLKRLLGEYDAATAGHQRLIAAVLTVKFDRDRPLHEQFDQLVAFSMIHVALDRRLTSLAVLHAPAIDWLPNIRRASPDCPSPLGLGLAGRAPRTGR